MGGIWSAEPHHSVPDATSGSELIHTWHIPDQLHAKPVTHVAVCSMGPELVPCVLSPACREKEMNKEVCGLIVAHVLAMYYLFGPQGQMNLIPLA